MLFTLDTNVDDRENEFGRIMFFIVRSRAHVQVCGCVCASMSLWNRLSRNFYRKIFDSINEMYMTVRAQTKKETETTEMRCWKTNRAPRQD